MCRRNRKHFLWSKNIPFDHSCAAQFLQDRKSNSYLSFHSDRRLKSHTPVQHYCRELATTSAKIHVREVVKTIIGTHHYE